MIKCSLFKVDALSLNGTDAMGLPPGTVIDDSACPAHPTTLVWLGGGTYPGNGAAWVVTDLSCGTPRSGLEDRPRLLSEPFSRILVIQPTLRWVVK